MKRSKGRKGFAAFGVSLAATLIVWGCGAADRHPGAAYPSELSPESTPKDVAQVLIQALEDNDKDTLLGLVALTAGREEFDIIYQRYGRENPMTPEEIGQLIAAGWGATHDFMQPGSTQVVEEEISRDKATVTAEARGRNDEPRLLKISLVREDGVWKILPGLESSAPRQ